MMRRLRYIITGWMVIASMMARGQLGVAGDTAGVRAAFDSLLGSAAYLGIDSNRYTHMPWTAAAFPFLKALHRGEGIYEQVSYDGVTPPYGQQEDALLATEISQVTNADEFRRLIYKLTPHNKAYDTLLTALTASIPSTDSTKKRQLTTALNIYRWIHHHPFTRYIVINIASATLRYYEADTVRLQMRVVVGKPSTRTPRFAAWCDNLVLYPYWNVPRKIAVNEFFPIFRRAPGMVDVMNMQILDAKGRVVDPSTIQWSRWNRQNFPYSMRQSTGCDNALGVLKFNLNSPYDVYMHDTNLKAAFLFPNRYLSHGCIRLEKPFELGVLVEPTLDTAVLTAGLKDQHPRTLRIAQPVPVFVIYLTADVTREGKLAYYRDIYHLLQ